MKKLIEVLALISFILISNAAFSQENSGKTPRDAQFGPEEQFAREEALRGQERDALEVGKANADMEDLRLKAEGIIAEDSARAQKETDALSQELAEELSKLFEEVEKEAAEREKELKKEEANNLKQAVEVIEQTTQELNKDLKRIKLRPPRP